MSATKTRKTHTLTEAEKAARKEIRAARVTALESAAESFELDDDDRAMMKAFESLCEHYSEGNALLILAQCAEQGLRVKGLSDVGAFGTFVAAGRAPRKGAHANIFVWAPAGSAAQADKVEDVPASATPDKKSTRKFWRLAPLFHISQTEKIKPKEEVK